MKKCIHSKWKIPPNRLLSISFNKGFTTIICADGGANSAQKIGIIPDYIIGDLDSLTKVT